MTNPEIDEALMTATEKVKLAEERLRQTPVESPDIVPKAYTVERRAEDVHALAEDAAQADEE